jgi:hypothetical protein
MKSNLIIFLLLIIIFICLIYLIANIHITERYYYKEINSSDILKNAFDNNTSTKYDQFSICEQWSQNYYNDTNYAIKYEEGKPPIKLVKDGVTYKYLKDKCPVILNKQMIEELKTNILQPFRCHNDYNHHNEIQSNSNINLCYSGPPQPYIRDYFYHWDTPSKDGCTIRDNILYENAKLDNNGNKIIQYKNDSCTPNTGAWSTYFDNYNKVYNTANKLDVDHTVPLKNAWISGAYNWKPWQLKAYANDVTLGHLEILEKDKNTSKGQKSYNNWSPKKHTITTPLNIECQYAADYAAVKHRWNLNVTKEELLDLENRLIDPNHYCNKTLPKAQVFFNKNNIDDTLGIGKSLKESLNYPEKIEIYGSNNNKKDNINYTDSIKNNINNYMYCNTNEDNKIIKPKQREIIKKKLYNEIKNNPSIFGIKNFDYFNYIKDNLDKNNICNIIYNYTKVIN